MLALAPEGGYVPLVWGFQCPGWDFAIVMLAPGLGLVLGVVAPGPEKSRG